MQVNTLKRTFTRIFFFIGLAAAMVACKKDNDNPNGPDPLPNDAKLTEYVNGEDYIRLSYNADGTVKKVILKSDANTNGDETEFTVTYNAQKKITSLQSQWRKIEPEYQNNVLFRAKMFEDNKQVGYTSYEYENGNLSKATLYFGESGTYLPLIAYTMAYTAQGNLDETVVLMATEPNHLERAGHIKYTYDQKSNPLYAHKELLALFWQAASKNNVTVENHFDSDLQPEDKFVYTYTYKNNGLPEKAIVKQGLPGQDPVTHQLTYTYQ
jgi:hypothetical protein